MERLGWSLLVFAITLNAVANILIKAGMRGKALLEGGQGILSIFLGILGNPFALGGLSCFGLAFILYSAVLSRLDLSMAYPIMTGAGFVLVVAASAVFFNETVSPLRLVGITAILVGILVIARS